MTRKNVAYSITAKERNHLMDPPPENPLKLCGHISCLNQAEYIVWYHSAGRLWSQKCGYHLLQDLKRGVKEFVNIQTKERYRVERIQND